MSVFRCFLGRVDRVVLCLGTWNTSASLWDSHSSFWRRLSAGAACSNNFILSSNMFQRSYSSQADHVWGQRSEQDVTNIPWDKTLPSTRRNLSCRGSSFGSWHSYHCHPFQIEIVQPSSSCFEGWDVRIDILAQSGKQWALPKKLGQSPVNLKTRERS